MRPTIPFAITAVTLLVLIAPARAGTVEDCEQVIDRNLQISGCTAVIGSGQWEGSDLAWAYNNRGFAYFDLAEYQRAIEDYDHALRLDPKLADAHFNRGLSFFRLGDFAPAIEGFDQTLRLEPDAAHAYHGRGSAYARLGELARAIDEYIEALRLDPDNPTVYFGRLYT